MNLKQMGADSTMTCGNCGTAIKKDDVYCKKCGTNVRFDHVGSYEIMDAMRKNSYRKQSDTRSKQKVKGL